MISPKVMQCVCVYTMKKNKNKNKSYGALFTKGYQAHSETVVVVDNWQYRAALSTRALPHYLNRYIPPFIKQSPIFTLE